MARATASSPRIEPDQMPKVIYTNTSVEYWGLGRAAALTHLTIDGTHGCHGARERAHLSTLAGTQHGEAAFPPSRRHRDRRWGIRCRRET